MQTNIEKNLLRMVLEYSINLWVFNQTFCKENPMNYTFYQENYKEFGTYKMNICQFKKIQKLTKEYTKQ